MDIEALIQHAEFDEWDRDSGTTGLCGTFALALKVICPEVDLAILCLKDANGEAKLSKDREPYWKHVVATHEGEIFDIDGLVELDDIVENYCWDNRFGKGGILVPITENSLLELLLQDNKSFDRRYLDHWTEKLSEAATIMDAKPLAVVMP